MYQQILTLRDLNIRRSEIWLMMGYRGNEPTPEIEELMERLLDEAISLCRPRVGYVVKEGKVLDGRQIMIGEYIFKPGRTITKYLDD